MKIITVLYGVYLPTYIQYKKIKIEHLIIHHMFILHLRIWTTLSFPMKVTDIPKFERKNRLNINVFELTKNILSPIYINNNYNEPQIDLLLYENHYCLITKLHWLINKNSHMQHVCRRCLTAFSSQPVLIDHIERCIYQKPTNIKFSYKDHLKFEDHHMKVNLPIRIYADFECLNIKVDDNPKIIYKQVPITVGFYLISPWQTELYSYQGIDSVNWFVKQMLKLEKDTKNYFKNDIPLKMKEEEEKLFQDSKVCWLCENEEESLVRDHDHLTGKYRGAACNECNLNANQKRSSFVPILFHNFSGYDCHLIFEELLTQAYNQNYNITIIPKTMENYVSVQIGCIRFLDSYRFLGSSLQQLVKNINNFPIMDTNGFNDELFKQKLAYPYEKFNLENFDKPLNLTKEDFFSTLNQSYPSDEEISRTKEIIRKYNIKTGKDLTLLYLKMDILQLADVFENFIQSSIKSYGINPLYSYSLPGYTWKVGLKQTKIKLDFIKEKELLLLLENNIRGGISSVMGDRYVESSENKQIYILMPIIFTGGQ